MESPTTTTEEDGSSMASTPTHPALEQRRTTMTTTTKKKKKKPGSLPLMMFINLEDGPSAHPECPHASNPFHKCADYCSPTWKQVGADTSEKGREKMGLSPRSINIFSPFHKRASKEHKAGSRESEASNMAIKITEKERTQSKCKHASNPFHNCAEYCFINNAKEDQAEGGTKTAISNHMKEESLGTNYASPSTPHHNHAESYFLECAEDNQTRKVSSEDEPNEEIKTSEERILNTECIYASNPYHRCSEYCIQKVDEKGKAKVTKSKEKKMDRNMAMKIKEPHECGDASNACPTCAKCCFPKLLENVTTKGVNRKKVLNTERWNVHPACRYASNPYHICVDSCYDRICEMGQEDNKKGTNAEKNSNTQSECVYASNPYHECGNYCLQKDYSDDSAEGALRENKKGRKMHKDTTVHPKSVSSSYHNSVEYSSKKFLEKDDEEDGKSEESQDCLTPTPSFTYSEHRFQLYSKDQVEKDGSSSHPSSPFLFVVGLIFMLVYLVVTTVLSGDKDVRMREHGNVNPKCKDASDLNHRCAASCFENMNNSTVTN